MNTTYCWILDSGGAGRGAWQGGVIYEFMRWCRENGSYPSVTMGASAGGYAAADVATGTEKTVMKGWTYWGKDGGSGFRAHLRSSIHYVMDEPELSGIFDPGAARKLLIFTTRVRRRDRRPVGPADRLRLFLQSATRKFPLPMKYLPVMYFEDPVVFALNLPEELRSEYVRPLTRANFHAVVETSCLIPLAMGAPIEPQNLGESAFPNEHHAVFIDGGYALKMPMRLFEEDPRFQAVAAWARADKTIIFCCDPKGNLWETSARLCRLNPHPAVARAVNENRLLIIHPDHRVEAGFLCTDNHTAMKTFDRGREQAQRLLRSQNIQRFFEID